MKTYSFFRYCSLALLASVLLVSCSKSDDLTSPHSYIHEGSAQVDNLPAGHLQEMIGVQNINLIKSLTISGQLNGDDIAFIRAMSGSDRDDKPTQGQLKALDITHTKIVKGGGYYLYCWDTNHYYTKNDTLGYMMFADTKLLTVSIPNTVVNISGSLSECHLLTSVTIPNSVTNINYAFQSCRSLTSVTIPTSVTRLYLTFFNCIRLKSIVIPKSITDMSEAFDGCKSLNEIHFKNPIPIDVRGSLPNNKNLKIYVPKESLDTYKKAEGWRNFSYKIYPEPSAK